MICIPLSPRGIEQVILNTTTQTIIRDAQNQFWGLVFTATTPPVVDDAFSEAVFVTVPENRF